MRSLDEIAVANGQLWEKLVKEGCGYTIPCLNLDRDVLRQYATGGPKSVPETVPEWLINGLYPPSVLQDVENKQVLCLASGGGQQSAAFGYWALT